MENNPQNVPTGAEQEARPNKKKFRLAGLVELLLALCAAAAGVYLLVTAPAAVPASEIAIPSYEDAEPFAPAQLPALPEAFHPRETDESVGAAEEPALDSVWGSSNDPGYNAFGGDAYTCIYKAARYCVVELDHITEQISTLNGNLSHTPRLLAHLSRQLQEIHTEQTQLTGGLETLSLQADFLARAAETLVSSGETSLALQSTLVQRLGESNVLAAQACNASLSLAARLSQLIRMLYLGFGAALIFAGGVLLCRVRLRRAC